MRKDALKAVLDEVTAKVKKAVVEAKNSFKPDEGTQGVAKLFCSVKNLWKSGAVGKATLIIVPLVVVFMVMIFRCESLDEEYARLMGERVLLGIERSNLSVELGEMSVDDCIFCGSKERKKEILAKEKAEFLKEWNEHKAKVKEVGSLDDRVLCLVNLKQISTAQEYFVKKFGRNPSSVEELCREDYFRVEPKCPSDGSTYELDGFGGVRCTGNKYHSFFEK
ncbi:MAG: hypothetical protein MJ240_08545 [Kiritimatiellae bacterium]|nr:hypothetical protein [Kiritimatiellia bacterium]